MEVNDIMVNRCKSRQRRKPCGDIDKVAKAVIFAGTACHCLEDQKGGGFDFLTTGGSVMPATHFFQ